MGLDAVEILLELEEEFGITVADQDAGSIVTVGDIHDLVRQRIRERDARRCVTLPAFLQTRSVLRQVRNDAHLSVRPSSCIVDMIPAADRKRFWHAIGALHGTFLPPLRRPRWLQVSLSAFSLCAFSLGLLTTLIDARITILGVLAAAGAMLMAYLVTSPWCVVPPGQMQNLGQVARHLAGVHAATRADVTLADVEPRVRRILAEQLGVEEAEITPEARLVEDLGMG